MESDKILWIEKLNKEYLIGGALKPVLRNFTLDVAEGEFVCILGYSGCGKTTLLRLLAGLEEPTSGTVWLQGEIHQKPSKDILLLFQDFNQLFPWRISFIHCWL